jgi:hypothetical protein
MIGNLGLSSLDWARVYGINWLDYLHRLAQPGALTFVKDATPQRFDVWFSE